MKPGPCVNTSVDSLREPSDNLQAHIKKSLDIPYQTTAFHEIVSLVDYITRMLNYNMNRPDKEPQEQLKLLTKIFHHLRTSAAIECTDEDDGSADYWIDFFRKVSEYFRIHDANEWVRQLYKQNETAQSSNIAMSSNSSVSSGVDMSLPVNPPSENGKWTPEVESRIFDGEPLRDGFVGRVERRGPVEVEHISGQALEADSQCHTNPLQNELTKAKFNEQVHAMSAASGSPVRNKQAESVERDRLMDTMNTVDTAQSEPAEIQGVVDDPVKSVAIWGVSGKGGPHVSVVVGRRAIENELIEIEHGMSGAIQDCAIEGISCESEYGVGITTRGGAVGDERGPDESMYNRLTEGASATYNASGNDNVEDRPARNAYSIGDTNDTKLRTSLGSEGIVSAAIGVGETSEGKTPNNEGRSMANGIAIANLTDARPSGGLPFNVEPADTSGGCLRSSVAPEKSIDSNAGPSKLDPVGSAKTLKMDDFEIQSRPVEQFNAKKYGIPYGTAEGSAHVSVQRQPTATSSWQSKSVNESTEPNSNGGSIQLELAEHGMAEREPAWMKPVGGDQPGKACISDHTLPPVGEVDFRTHRLATKQLAMSSEETSPMLPKQDCMSVEGLEAGDSAGLDFHLLGTLRPLEVFRWPCDEHRGGYVVVIFRMQHGVGAVVIGVLGMLLYFAYRWWL